MPSTKYYKPALFGLSHADQQIESDVVVVPICGAQVVQMIAGLMRLNGMAALNEKELVFFMLHPEIAAMILFGYECPDKHMRVA